MEDPNLPDDGTETDIDVPDGEAPVAQCSVNQAEVSPPFETAIFDSSGSYDPSGGEITARRWTLSSAPIGNEAGLSSFTGMTTSLTPQLAGTYEVSLVVTNNLGIQSEPALCTVTATPGEDFWVEMFWSHGNEDMDLHVLRPGGVLKTDDDCYFANCDAYWGGLDWGQYGNTSDDPVLDLDDIPGTGPENINIARPESGWFTVVVHDYETTGVRYEETQVTVNVFLGGVQVFTDTRRVVGEGSYTYFAKVNPSTDEVQACSPGGC